MLIRKLSKYSKALLQHSFPLIKLLPSAFKQKPNTPQAVLAAQWQQAYFPDKKHNLDSSYFKNLSSLTSPWQIYFNLVPLPMGVEKAIYGQSMMEAHHHARVELIRHQLPKATRILDLGGADAEQACGALLAMGYPHKPQGVHIIDLPVEKRVFDPSRIPKSDNHQHGPTYVSYSYHSMTEIEKIPFSQPFDMAWMGQTVEHIHPQEFSEILKKLKKIITPGAKLCLDTPNRNLTRLLDPDQFIHPDHKLEYQWQDLDQVIQKHGFKRQKALAINPLPLSLKTAHLHRFEFLNSPSLGKCPEEGFSFYLEYTWPG